jgi:transaldolase
MKLFLDTADIALIKNWVPTRLIDGVTTNPTHLSKEGGSPVEVVKKICALLPDGHISVEVTHQEAAAVYQQAQQIAAISDNVIVKIPCHADYYPVIARLIKDGIRLNITLVFSVSQALCMAKLGVDYISPFIGRLDDIGQDGIGVLADICSMVAQYGFESQVLAASVRTVGVAESALLAGADAITVPGAVLQQMATHTLTDAGMKQFAVDWKKLGISEFP